MIFIMIILKPELKLKSYYNLARLCRINKIPKLVKSELPFICDDYAIFEEEVDARL